MRMPPKRASEFLKKISKSKKQKYSGFRILDILEKIDIQI
jgi:hypothetical protein